MAPPKEKPADDEVVKKALKAYQIKKRSRTPSIYIKDKTVEYEDLYRQDRGDVRDLIPELPEYKSEEESESHDDDG